MIGYSPENSKMFNRPYGRRIVPIMPSKGQRISLNTSINQLNNTATESILQHEEVKVYKSTHISFSFNTTVYNKYQKPEQVYIAIGKLIGEFQFDSQLQNNIGQSKSKKIKQAQFYGKFEGVYTIPAEEQTDSTIIFYGQITHFKIKGKQHLPEQNSFKGFFEGNIYNIAQRSAQKLHLLQNKKNKEQHKFVKQHPPQYYLPTLCRFEIEEIKQVDLQKLNAVVAGYLYLEVYYNQTIGKMIDKNFQLKQGNKNHVVDVVVQSLQKQQNQQNQKQNVFDTNVLKMHLNFNRGVSIPLTLYKEQDIDQSQSQSDWSIDDKDSYFQFQNDKQQKILKFKIWNKYNAEIDNSYGAFFAPFNLNVLRITASPDHFKMYQLDQCGQLTGKPVKFYFLCSDFIDFQQNQYDPFKPLKDLSSQQGMNNQKQINRLRKINRMKCSDIGLYHIADNRLALYPHFKSVLFNKTTINASYPWWFGCKDKTQFLSYQKQLKVESLEIMYDNWKHEEDQTKLIYRHFTFQIWNNFIIQIPIYKYITIDIIQIFFPLLIFSIISLFIFNQANGIYDNKFTTLALRIINVCSLMIAYVSLIPTLLSKLPPMPSSTLIQILTYLATVPNLLALVSSIVDYTVDMGQWMATYRAFDDGIFIACFVLTIFIITTLIAMLIVYWFKQYKIHMPKMLLPDRQSKNKHASPIAQKYIKQVSKHRQDYFIQEVKDNVRKKDKSQ